MGKIAFLDALKRAMLGLPPEVQAKTLAYYEQRFVDGQAAGRSEEAVGAELDDPTKIAMTLRASAHLSALSGFEQKKNPAGVLRVAVSAVGLAIFNLFMIVPAIVYAALLFAVYVSALTFYLSGIVVSASGLAGTSDIVVDLPSRFVQSTHGAPRQLHVDITDHGFNISPEPSDDDGADAVPGRSDADADGSDSGDTDTSDDGDRAAADEARADAAASENGRADDRTNDGAGAAAGTRDDNVRDAHARARRGMHTQDDGSLRISTGMDAESRTGQTFVGFGLVLGGIALFLLALLISRYTLTGLKRYLQMNLALLRGNGH